MTDALPLLPELWFLVARGGMCREFRGTLGRDHVAWLLAMTCRSMLALLRPVLRPGMTVHEWFEWFGAYADVLHWPSLRERAVVRRRRCGGVFEWLRRPLSPTPPPWMEDGECWHRIMCGAAATGRLDTLIHLWSRSEHLQRAPHLPRDLVVHALHGRHDYIVAWLGAVPHVGITCKYIILRHALRAGYSWDEAERFIGWLAADRLQGDHCNLGKLLSHLAVAKRTGPDDLARLRAITRRDGYSLDDEPSFVFIYSSPPFYRAFFGRAADEPIIEPTAQYLLINLYERFVFSLRYEQWHDELYRYHDIVSLALIMGLALPALRRLHAYLLTLGVSPPSHWARTVPVALRQPNNHDLVTFLLEHGTWKPSDRRLLEWSLRADHFYGLG